MVDCAGGRKGSAPGLVMERAVQEMSQLRQEIAQFMAQYERGAQHTRKRRPGLAPCVVHAEGLLLHRRQLELRLSPADRRLA